MSERSAGTRLAFLLGTGFGSGCSPVAPGTCGTAAALLLVFLLSRTALPPVPTLFVLAILATLASIPIGNVVERTLGRKDPQSFVLDEFAGVFVALLRLEGPWPPFIEYVAAFLLFRMFDIIKPPPCRRLQGLRGGLGIVIDDVVAGLYALAGVSVLRDVLRNPPW